MSVLDKALGAYLGFACGDALGLTVEFLQPEAIQKQYGVHQDIIGGGWLGLPAGAITNDTEMTLAVGNALIDSQAWNVKAVADEFVLWLNSNPTDIGDCCLRGIRRYKNTGELSGPEEEFDAGNSACIRNIPLMLASLYHDELFEQWSREQNHLTHNNPLTDQASFTLGNMVRQLITGNDDAAKAASIQLIECYPEFNYIPYPANASGYIVDTLQTVFHFFFTTTTFEECVVATVNQGGDANSNGALAGMLAGAKYGVKAIPERWLSRLDPVIHSQIRQQTRDLLTLAKSINVLTPIA